MLGPYELNRIYTGDARELAEQIPDESIDLTVTSPPYDNLRAYNGYTFDFEAIAAQLWRVTKPGGVVVWVVGDATVNGSETGTSFRQALHFMALGFNLHDTMIYQKPHLSFPDHVRYWQGFEYMFVFSKGAPKTFNPIKDRPNKGVGRKVTGLGRNSDGTFKERSGAGRYYPPYSVRFNVWKMANAKRYDFNHPAVFPEALAHDHIISWSNPSEIVLDPMCGSGTTLKMAKETGRRYLGFDISREYVEFARERVRNTQPPLPIAMPVQGVML